MTCFVYFIKNEYGTLVNIDMQTCQIVAGGLRTSVVLSFGSALFTLNE